MDVTGVTARLARGIHESVLSDEPEAKLEALCKSYRLGSPPRFLDEPADLLVSGMVLSQLGLQPKLAAKRLYEQRFGKIAHEAEERWTSSWNDLDMRLQQDHADALCEDAALAVLTSDVVHHSGGESWSVIGAERLEQRVPQHLEVLLKKSWTWARVQGAVSTDVHAVLLRRRPG